MRDGALDALRGFAVLGMVVVNLQGSPPDAFPILAHAPWDGMTFADLVFPMFLLAMGLALPLTTDRRSRPPGIGRILQRAALLYLIGLALGALLGGIIRSELSLAGTRYTGVLERIAIVYLVCALLCRAVKGWQVPLLATIALLAAHGALLYLPAPGEAAASMAPGAGLSGWLDRTLLPGRLLRETWDPEGALSTLSAIATGLIGVTVQRLRLAGNSSAVEMGCAAACLALGFAALALWPLNKALWTPSFALVTAGASLALLAALRLGWPYFGVRAPGRVAAALGQHALTLYVVHTLLTTLLVVRIGGERIWLHSFEAVAATGLSASWASLVYALAAGALSIAITFAMVRRGWALRA